MPINADLVYLREFYTHAAEIQSKAIRWELAALLVSAAVIVVFGNAVFSVIGMIAFGLGAYATLHLVGPTPLSEKNNQAGQILAIPGFFDFAMQHDQRWLASVELMREGFHQFMAQARPAVVPPAPVAVQ